MLNNSWNYGKVLNQNGEILIGQASGNPLAAFLTSSSQTLTFAFGPGSINIEMNLANTFFNPLQVVNGGTGRTVLTAFGVVIGEGANNVNVTAAGTNGQVLIASSTGDPRFSTITSTGGFLTFTFGYNSLNIDLAFSTNTFFNPLQVVNGGTGRTVLTTFGVLIGEGSNGVNVTAAGTNGQVLIAASTSDPKFATITSTGGSIAFSSGYNSLNIDVAFSTSSFFNPLPVANGGTGRTVLTTFGVLVGEGSNNINVTAAGTNGQVLIASSTGDPQFANISSSAGTISFTFGYNSLNMDANFSSNTFFNPLQVANGGTGRTILTTYGVLVGEGSNNVNVTVAGTNGQVLIASSTGDPQFATITSTSSTITFTFGYNSLNIEATFSTNTFFNPLLVANGGTGRTILTTFGVLIGEGSNNVNVTAAGTNGQVLIASSTGDPKFATITSSGNSLTFTFGYNSLNMDVNFSLNSFFNPILVANGGTGQTILTTYGVLIGEGSNDVNVTAAGTNGQVLIASSTGDPQFATITSSGNTVTFAFGYNLLNIDVAFSTNSFFNPLSVANGGTGQTVLTTYGVLIGEGSNDVNVTAAGTNGQILIASSTGDPKFATITSSGNTVTFRFSYNSLNIDVIPNLTIPYPIVTGNGGTGRTLLTTFGVLIGEGSRNVNVTAAGTNGQVLIAATTGDPKFATITSTGGTLTFKFGVNSLDIEINFSNSFFSPLLVGNGGTGRTILTTFGVLIGEGSNNVNVTAAGTNGQVLIASSTGDPKFARLTSSGGSVTFSFGYNTLNIEINEAGRVDTVDAGGTGRTVLTTFGVLIGEGSNSVNVTAAGTNGQVLIASSTGDPKFARITSSGGSVTFAFGYNALNIEIVLGTQVNPVTGGGTGRTVLTTFGVLIGEGSNNVNVTAAGTNGQVLIASSTGDPKFSTITSTGGTITFTFGYNSLNIEFIPSSQLTPVSGGGTGRTVLTAFGVLIGEGSNNVNVTAAGTNGQTLIASSTGDPKFATITSSSGTLLFTGGYNSLNIDLNVVFSLALGGTGRSILTTYGVLLGEGSNSVNVTAAGTNGQTLIASSTGDPKFATITSSAGSITFTFGYNSLNIEFVPGSLVIPVQAGGTGRTVLTTFGVLIGEGSNNINVTAAGTNGQVLIASSTGDPKFATITSSGGSVTFTFGYNSLNIEYVAGSLVIPVQAGGTGRTVLTTFGVLVGEGSNNVNVTAAGTNGQVLIASSTGDPKFATITSSGLSIAFTAGFNSLNMDVNAGLGPSVGGTGRTILTTYGVLIGEGSKAVNVTAAGTNGQILIASNAGDPAFATITSTGGSVVFTSGYNSLNLEVVSSGLFIPVQGGGTGRTVLTTFGVLIGEGSNNIDVTAAGTNGQLLIAATNADPAFRTITSTGGSLSFTFGVNSINIDIAGALGINFGGTDRTILTTYGVLIGEGSNAVDVTAAGTNGQVLIAGANVDPKFSTITSTGGTITFTFGVNSLNIEFIAGSQVIPVQAGGTGLTILTTFGVLIGEGSNDINVTAAGTNGQLLIAATNADPAFSTITSTGGSLSFTFGVNSINIDIAAPVGVNFGGTDRTILTTYGVLIGEGSNAVDVTAAGTNGQVLIAGANADPKFSTITSTGGSITFTFGFNSLNIEYVASALVTPVQGGGTGRTILTTFGVLIGEGSNNIDVTAAGTNGQVLLAGANVDPKFSTITSSGGTITFSFGVNSLNIEFALAGATFLNPWPVANGGTGRTILTTFGVLLGEGSRNINVTAAGTNGQVLIAGTNTNPAFSTITSTGGSLSFTFGANSMNIDFASILAVNFGGTNRTVLTTFGVLIGEGSNSVNVTAAGTNGQLLIAAGGADPKFSTVTSTGGSLTFTVGANSLNIEANLSFIAQNLAYVVNTVTGITSSVVVASMSTSFNYYSVDTTNGTVTLQFPATTSAGMSWVVKDRTGLSGLNPIAITTSSGTVTFDGQTTFNLTNPFGSIQVMFNGLTPARYEIF